MMTNDLSYFESSVAEKASALCGAVRYSGALSKASPPEKKAPPFLRPAAQLACALAAALAVGAVTFFVVSHFKDRINPGTSDTDTPYVSGTVDGSFGTQDVTGTDGVTAAPPVTEEPDTDPATGTDAPATDGDMTTEPHQTDGTEPETTLPETTSTDTVTEQESTAPETTVPETTAPETTAPHTTEPETTAKDTEKPDPDEQVAPAPEDKNGYKLFVNHIDLTGFTSFGVYPDGSSILPFSTILNFFEHGSAEVKNNDTVILKYEDETFTLKVKERVMTGNNYNGNWFENKQTETTALYIADGLLYADGGTVSAFLSEFAGGAVRTDKTAKTVTAVDFYCDEDTRRIPVLNESPGTFNKNGYKLYINGNLIRGINFDVSGDGDVTIPFSQVLNCLGHCEAKDFGSIIYIEYDGKSYQLKPLYYELTGDGIEGNWFKDKATMFIAFMVKDRVTYSDPGVLNDFLADFAGGCATIDHDAKIIEIKDKYYDEEKKEPVNPDGTRYEIPFSDGAFFTVTPAGENEINPGRTRIDFYVPAKDDDDRLVLATYVTFPDGARVRIAGRRKTNNAIELFCFCEYSGKTDGADHSYEAFASQIEIYDTVYKPDAAFPYAYTVSGKSVSFTYTDDTKDRKTALNLTDYNKVETLVSTANDRLAYPDQLVDTSVSPVILYESDGTAGSFMQPYDSSDPFTLIAGNSLFYGY